MLTDLNNKRLDISFESTVNVGVRNLDVWLREGRAFSFMTDIAPSLPNLEVKAQRGLRNHTFIVLDF